MLQRVYNLAIHASGLPLDPNRTPGVWMLNWSRQLESDRMKRTLLNKTAAANTGNGSKFTTG